MLISNQDRPLLHVHKRQPKWKEQIYFTLWLSDSWTTIDPTCALTWCSYNLTCCPHFLRGFTTMSLGGKPERAETQGLDDSIKTLTEQWLNMANHGPKRLLFESHSAI